MLIRKEKKGKERKRKEKEEEEEEGEGRKRKFTLSILLVVMDCIGLDKRQYEAKNTRDLRVAKQCSLADSLTNILIDYLND